MESLSQRGRGNKLSGYQMAKGTSRRRISGDRPAGCGARKGRCFGDMCSSMVGEKPMLAKRGKDRADFRWAEQVLKEKEDFYWS